MKTVAIINHKGGVGKTTFTGCTAQALALCGFRVLVIDNDSQHNLSTMMGSGVQSPGIADVYGADAGSAPAVFLRAVKKSVLPGLHIVTSHRDLSERSIAERHVLETVLAACGLERFYDYVLIDNAPGMDMLQACAITAADELFVPTELRQFAVDGIVEMAQVLENRCPDGGRISRIIPNFYRDTRKQNTYISVLRRMFPGKVTETAVPVDAVFDELVTENKVLFIHRLYSRGAAYYLKLVHELFNLDEDSVWQSVVEKRKQRLSEDARARFLGRRAETTEAPA